MSQTKAQLLDPQGDFTLTGQLIGVGATFSGNVSIAGTLTKQDVTNVDSIGVITARNRIDMTQGYQLGWKSGSTERARIHGDSGSNFIIETGATPTERVRVTSSGRVGIGSNSPKTSLDVAGLVNLVNSSPEVHFTTGASHYNWRVAAQEVVHQGFEIASGTESADGVNDTYTTRLAIKADGKVGLGTVSPDELLHIESTGTAKFRLTDNRTSISDGSQYGVIQFEQRDSNTPGVSVEVAAVMTDTSNGATALQIKTGTPSTITERLRITSDGKIGIGDNDPDALLSIKGDSNQNSNPSIRLKDGTDSRENWISNVSGDLFLAAGGNDNVYHSRIRLMDGNIINFDIGGTSAVAKINADGIEDSKGNLRSIPRLDKTSAYTITAADAGKAITADADITIPNSVMSEGDAVTIFADGSADITITQGSGLTMYNSADGSTGNRTLALRGVATIWFKHTSYCYISGSGLS